MKRICIGKITSAHGVKGLVKIRPYCEDINLLNGKLYCDNVSDKSIEITLKNLAGKHILAEIKGINSREEAEKLKCSLFISRETLPDTEDDVFYIEDLIGLHAINNGDLTGTVIAVPNFGAGELLEIKKQSGDSFYVPFQERYIASIDLEAETIILRDIQELIL